MTKQQQQQQPVIRKRSFVRGRLWIPRHQELNKNNTMVTAPPVVATNKQDKIYKSSIKLHQEQEEVEPSDSSHMLLAVSNSSSVRNKPQDIVGWDDVLCRPIYAASSSTSTTRRSSSSNNCPLMQSTSGSSSSDDDEEEEKDDMDNDFFNQETVDKKKHITSTTTTSSTRGTLATTNSSTTPTMDPQTRGGAKEHGLINIRHRRCGRRTFGLRRKRTLEEIELLEKLNDHDNDCTSSSSSSRSITLVQGGNNNNINRNVHDDDDNYMNGVVERVIMDQHQQLLESSNVYGSRRDNSAKMSKNTSSTTINTTAPIFHRRKHKKAKTTTLSSLSTNKNNNENPGNNDSNDFDFTQDDGDDDDDDTDGNEQQHKTTTSPKPTVIKQPSARTSLGSARAFFDHLDRHCPILLQAVDNEKHDAKNVCIAPAGQVKNTNGRTRRFVSLRDASVAKAYQAYGQACRETGVPPLSLREFWKQRRMMAIEHGGGDADETALLYDCFLDE